VLPSSCYCFSYSRLPGAYTGFGAGLTFVAASCRACSRVQVEDSGIRHRLDKQIRQSPDERVDSIRRITRCRAVKIASEPAHLIFERRKSADVMDFVLFVKRSYGFGADDFLRLAHTVVTRTLGLTMRMVASTMSPPLLRSATMRSAACEP
jgi:hypothetical protein